jgi:hypothetical protein
VTGTQSLYTLGGAALFVIFVWFLGKLILRLAGRKVVKVYTVVHPWSPPPIYVQAPPLVYPTAFLPPNHLPQTTPNELRNAENDELTEDEQFDDIVRNFYSP